MKRILAMLLAASLAVSLPACKKKEDEENKKNNKPAKQTTATTEKKKEDKTETKDELARVAAMSPEDYLEYIILEKNDIPSIIAEGVTELKKNMESSSSKGSISVKTGEAFVDFLKEVDSGTAEMYSKDYSWLTNATIDYETDTEGRKLAGILATLKMNNTAIISADTVIDLDKGDLYVTLPEVSSKHLYYDIEDYDNSALLRSAAVIDALPGEEITKKLVTNYTTIIFDNVSDVKKENADLTVGDITQNVNMVSFKVTSDDAYSCNIELFETFTKDKDIREFITKVAEYSYNEEGYNEWYGSVDEMVNKLYEGFESELAELKNDKDAFADTQDMDFVIYTNDVNDITGITAYAGDDIVLSFLYAESNGKFAVEFAADGHKILSGNGTVKDEKMSGKVDVTHYDSYEAKEYELMVVTLKDIDLKKLDEDILNGTVTLTPSKDFTVCTEMDSFTNECELILNFKQTKKEKFAATATLKYKDKTVITVDTSNEEKSKRKISVPKDALDFTDEEEWTEYLGSINIATVMTNLKKAGLATNVIMSLMGVLM